VISPPSTDGGSAIISARVAKDDAPPPCALSFASGAYRIAVQHVAEGCTFRQAGQRPAGSTTSTKGNLALVVQPLAEALTAMARRGDG
jgi:hypothetical protein